MISVTIFLPRFSTPVSTRRVSNRSLKLGGFSYPSIPSIVLTTKNAAKAGREGEKKGEKGREEGDEWDGWTIEFLVERTKRGSPRKYSFPDKTNIRFGDALRFSPPRKTVLIISPATRCYNTGYVRGTFAVEIAPLSVREMNFPRRRMHLGGWKHRAR